MSKLIKCDRCGKIDNDKNLVFFGTEEFFTGRIEHYQYSDVPEFTPIDLCRSCNAELNANICDFMAAAQSNKVCSG